MNACDVGRERIHQLFDAEDAPAPAGDLDGHLATCPGCRELYDDLVTVRRALRAIPVPSLPAEALDAVWSATVRAPRAVRRAGIRRAVAAAVVVTGVSLTTLWMLRVPAEPSAAEMAVAEAQADLVFGYTARALDATREVTERRVLGSRVSPAVRGMTGASTSGRRN